MVVLLVRSLEKSMHRCRKHASRKAINDSTPSSRKKDSYSQSVAFRRLMEGVVYGLSPPYSESCKAKWGRSGKRLG